MIYEDLAKRFEAMLVKMREEKEKERKEDDINRL
jgi:hypothetical protein